VHWSVLRRLVHEDRYNSRANPFQLISLNTMAVQTGTTVDAVILALQIADVNVDKVFSPPGRLPNSLSKLSKHVEQARLESVFDKAPEWAVALFQKLDAVEGIVDPTAVKVRQPLIRRRSTAIKAKSST